MKKNITTKSLSLILALVLTVSSLVACAPNTNENEAPTVPVVAETVPATTEATEVTEAVETQPEATEPVVNYAEVNETVYATSNVNVRNGAGTDHEKVGELVAGESVTRISIGDNGWSKVTYNGKTAYVSSKYLTTEKPHQHNYKTETVAPTCESQGYTVYTCDCGSAYTGSYVNATGHNYKTETVAATTESQGYDIHTCKSCGDSYKDNYTDKLVENKPSGPIHTNSSVYNTLIGFKSKYPEGMAFDNSVGYSWMTSNGVYYADSGCAAFASELSHTAFGTKDFVKLYDITINDVRVGDILRINGNSHSVIVLEVYADYVVIAEANYGGTVHWGRTLTASLVANASYLISRYADRLG